MKVSALKSRVRTVYVEVPGEDEGAPPERVWVKYRPGELTLEVAENLVEVAENRPDHEAIGALLEPILDSWDLEADDGSQLAVTPDVFRTVPLQFLGLLIQAITDDARPNPQMAGTSQGT